MKSLDKLSEIMEYANRIVESAARIAEDDFDTSLIKMGSSVENCYCAIHSEPLLQRAKFIWATRRRRDTIFEGLELFADPAWDILLDLFIAQLEHRDISVTSAGMAGHVPLTTGLRWVSVLETANLVVRERDPEDLRRLFVRLTPRAVIKLSTVIASLSDESFR